MKKCYLTWGDIIHGLSLIDNEDNIIYGVPKGGMIMTAFLKKATVVYNPEEANLIIDDIIDSGRTELYYTNRFEAQFWALINSEIKFTSDKNVWYIFPWERDHPAGEETVDQNITRLIQYIGEDPEREGLKGTPQRMVRSYEELFSGYDKDPEEVFTTFESGTYDQIVLLKDVEIFSMCEHHMLPFYGKAHIAYIPDDKVIGISKLARLIDIYSRRLQIQERIGEQVTDALMKYLNPMGAACIIESNHLCMRMRGVSKQESSMVTSSLKGAFFSKPEARNELMNMLK